MRFVVVATVIIFVLYWLSSHRAELSHYVAAKSGDIGLGQAAPAPPAQQAGSTDTTGSKGDTKASLGAIDQLTGNTLDLGQSAAPHVKANATFVTLARNQDLSELIESIRQVEDRFNHKFHYDWVFLNDKEFNEEFIKTTSAFVSGKTKYGLIPSEHWGFPEWIDQEKAALVREQMREKKVIYGDSISYRHMCRYESGFFWRHPELDEYKYYWRVEPSIKLFCDIDYDLFKFMEEKKLKYGFSVSLYEYLETIPTLWQTTKDFLAKFPQYQAKDSMIDFVSDDGGETYNKCHFWSNFELGDLDFWRGEAYTKYFDYLDHAGGFFYERWGDAPVHSIAASLFLNKDEIHYFEDVGYYHVPFTNCPTSAEERLKLKCTCKPTDNFAWHGYSCTPRYYKVKNLQRPKGWESQTN